MFERLVVSSSERRQGRTLRCFLGTFVAYVLLVASAMVVSVVAANPELSDCGNIIICRLGVPVPVPKLGTPKQNSHPTAAAAHANIYNVRSLEAVTTGPSSTPASAAFSGPPQVGPVGSPTGLPTGDPNAEVDMPGIGPNAGDTPLAGVERAPAPPMPRTQDRPSLVRVPPNVLQGKAIERRTPDYPQLAKQIRLEGTVGIEIIISPDGHVESARVIGGHPVLAAAALDAACRWRFEPTKLNGTPVRATGVITFVFKLE